MKKVKEDKAKLEMTQFNEGWWNCFLSYTDIISFYNNAYDLAFEQMSSAGVRAEEIDYVLDSDFCMREETKEILKGYLNQTSERYT